MLFRVSRTVFLASLLAVSAVAEPLSQTLKIDFFRDVPSRNLRGLATRSDGRLTAGPVLHELQGRMDADLLWSMMPLGRNTWLVGTGPNGRILRVELESDQKSFRAETWAEVNDAQVYVIRGLPDGSVLAGSSPRGGLHLLREGKVVASASLPVDSVFDLLVMESGEALVGTGNPGRVYRVDLATFAQGGVVADTLRTDEALAARGIRTFGEIRDRNVRRLARGADGRVLAGSAPSGNLYAFPAEGGAPELLLNHTRAEITDLRVEANGDIYALVIFSGAPGGQLRLMRPTPVPPESGSEEDAPPVPLPREVSGEPVPLERFAGRSALIWIAGGNGFPETLASRSNIALYRIAEQGDLLIMPGGDAGEIVGFDRENRRSLTFGGSTSAQLSDLLRLDEHRWLLLRNNPAGLAMLDFNARSGRKAETRRLDLRGPGTLGALRFNRLRGLQPDDLQIELRANRADDEVEGWSPWRRAEEQHGGWSAGELRGRYVQLRLELPASLARGFEIDSAQLYHLPQNRRPMLQGFRILSPNFSLVPRGEASGVQLLTLGQVIGEAERGSSPDDQRSALLASQIVPQPGAQLVYWTLEDADGDRLAASFAIRRDGTDRWIELAVDSTEPWVQFDRTHLPDGVYFTRLVVREQAPRPPAERLEVTFQADDLVIDNTPPEIVAAAVDRRDGRILISATGADALSLLAGIEVNCNNGHRVTVEHPADGILDSGHETFVAELQPTDASGATEVEIILHDAVGNTTGRRLPLR